jgi:hypothetical protein
VAGVLGTPNTGAMVHHQRPALGQLRLHNNSDMFSKATWVCQIATALK